MYTTSFWHGVVCSTATTMPFPVADSVTVWLAAIRTVDPVPACAHVPPVCGPAVSSAPRSLFSPSSQERVLVSTILRQKFLEGFRLETLPQRGHHNLPREFALPVLQHLALYLVLSRVYIPSSTVVSPLATPTRDVLYGRAYDRIPRARVVARQARLPPQINSRSGSTQF